MNNLSKTHTYILFFYVILEQNTSSKDFLPMRMSFNVLDSS